MHAVCETVHVGTRTAYDVKGMSRESRLKGHIKCFIGNICIIVTYDVNKMHNNLL